jgi:hypothetical protein
MPILVTVSVNLAESVTLRDLQQFLQAAEQNGADLDVDLREYDENNDLVGLAAVGAMGSADADADDDADEDADEDADDEDADDEDADDEDAADDDDADAADDRGDAADDRGDAADDRGDANGARS